MKDMILAQADGRALPLADESVDLVVTSPPYFALRSYRQDGEHYDGQLGSEETPQQYLEALWAVTAELWRVLKPSGSLFVNLGDKYAGSGGHNNGGISKPDTKRKAWEDDGIMKATRRNAPDRYRQALEFSRPKSLLGLPWLYALGCTGAWPFPQGMAGPDRWILRAEIIWEKKNGMPESVTDRVRRNHEQWFHLVKSGTYFSGIDEIRAPYSPRTEERYALGFNERANYDAQRVSVHTELGGDFLEQNPLGKLPGSVWSMSTEPLIVPEEVQEYYRLPDHFAPFPSEWPRLLILGWSPSAICTKCGEGRFPVTERNTTFNKARDQEHASQIASRGAARAVMSGGTAKSTLNGITEATIIGYACACSPEAPPTRPAVVLDPFSGSGTTVGVARTLGRLGIGLDLSFDYCRLASWRVHHSGHFAKAESRTNLERQGVLL